MSVKFSRSLLVAGLAAAFIAAGTVETASASTCTREASLVRVSKKQLSHDKAALRNASARLRRNPHSLSAKRAVSRATLRVRADNRLVNRRRQKFVDDCLPGY